jgi:F0F1-type ATP synthase assembly protein I
LIGFLLLGTAAGILNLVRAVRRMNAQLGAGSGPADTSPEDDEE